MKAGRFPCFYTFDMVSSCFGEMIVLLWLNFKSFDHLCAPAATIHQWHTAIIASTSAATSWRPGHMCSFILCTAVRARGSALRAVAPSREMIFVKVVFFSVVVYMPKMLSCDAYPVVSIIVQCAVTVTNLYVRLSERF